MDIVYNARAKLDDIYVIGWTITYTYRGADITVYYVLAKDQKKKRDEWTEEEIDKLCEELKEKMNVEGKLLEMILMNQ